MTIDEAIRHCEEVAEHAEDCQCAADHRQLAEWLRDYQKIKPERKTGKWMRVYCRPNVLKYLGWTCSECGNRTGEEYAPHWFKYCPNCGADMREGEQE